MAAELSRVVQSDQTFLFGPGCAREPLGKEIAQRKWRRVALLASNSAVRSGARDDLLRFALAGVEVVVVDEPVAGHAPVADSERIAQHLARGTLDAIVALGGGSVSDTAKAVSILLAEGGRLEDHCSEFRPPGTFVSRVLSRPKTPVVAVATTLSGAEVTPGGGGTTAAGIKRTFWDPQIACRIIAYDTELIRKVPSDILVSTSMNALAHCAEGLYSRTSNPISTAQALHAARLLCRGLRSAAGEPDAGGADAGGSQIPDPMSDLAAGAALSGLVISNARVGLHHAICHVLGARLGLPHGAANSVMLPHVLRFNEPETSSAQRDLSEAMGRPGLPAGDAVAELQRAVRAPSRLRDFGVREDQLDGVAADTMQNRGLYFNPRQVCGPEEITGILREAW
jgi:alcohol dehydrogenase class IV